MFAMELLKTECFRNLLCFLSCVMLLPNLGSSIDCDEAQLEDNGLLALYSYHLAKITFVIF